MPSAGEREVLQLGRGWAATDPIRLWLQRHPGPARVAAAVLAAALCLAGTAGLIRYLRGPSLPPPAAASAPADLQDLAGSWSVGADGRPHRPALVRVGARLRFDRLPPGGVDLLGISGPGVLSGTAPPVRIAAARATTQVLLSSTVDCTRARIPSVPGDYRLLARVRDGSRRFTRVLAAAGLAGPLSAAVNTACGSWLARRDLTVTAASIRVDPVRPALDVTLSVSNTGDHREFLSLVPPQGYDLEFDRTAGTVLSIGPGRSQVPLHVRLQACDGVTAAWGPFMADQPDRIGTDDVAPTSADFLGLEASAAGTTIPPTPPSPVDGLGPTGILTDEPVAQALVAAFRSACGELNQVVTLIDDPHARYDPATRRLDLTVQILLTPGRVRDLALTSIAPGADPTAFAPLWSRSAGLAPDRSGEVSVTLPYRAPAGLACHSDPKHGSGSALNGWIPGFAIVAHVPGPAGVRTVPFTGVPELDPALVGLLCRPPSSR